jgi:hypothetical protein
MIQSTGKVLLPALALALAGCSSMLGGELVKQGEPVGAITIVNRAGIEMNVVTLSRCNAMSHGLSRLGGGETIRHGQSRTWQVGPGCWDIGVGRTGSCSATSCNWHEAYDKVEVVAGRTTYSNWGPGGAE